jgi:hypothetical protein
MEINASLVFYFLVGIGVSVTVLLSNDGQQMADRALRSCLALIFWPVFLPVLLKSATATSSHIDARILEPGVQPASHPDDEMTRSIFQVESELHTALRSLDGWTETVLADQQDRFTLLQTAWHHQAARIRELDVLLGKTTTGQPNTDTSQRMATGEPTENGDRVAQSERGRRDNMQRLVSVRNQLYQDLMGTLAWVRELVTMIHLAKYTGAPASRADELVAQIAAAVEGLSEVNNWPLEHDALATTAKLETVSVD